MGSVWRFVAEDGVEREGEVVFVLGHEVRVARPTWDGADPLCVRDTVRVGIYSSDALRDVHRVGWLN